MTEYLCASCGKKVKDIDKVICPFCNGRILFKSRTHKVREMETG